ncbi:glycerol-3-phosphate dehydrogenase/oxidase [Carbonactinospora thermoautotrophica]|uniref:Glycerol-3-phosphate dehydrogenase n=1 Tax=Carbonactinospora thermoautotrophica TaxID=1469144 RepID=A0A132MXZ9_9ACTN|nr:glycerol-3-phosphate dehydrogenase/oxidase [Carbonactinospora thermoautotrophica]KWX02606.1 Glycerol-3-phosphate dehydrogenase [Carbonactinospora thermoautotrophica]KWX03676.1 glycerol-3-phosphate dehydrogenase [Carbonactinospora thermoautotrophica]KWX07496.1 glycerol-3-phosphate dehydrogenase [Carbonactinospora thermoautotrophica]MCX9190447.1 glycerol-3-phosphate dehydrogenase/oxidase [Carbonactinospora thermoautotrophica]
MRSAQLGPAERDAALARMADRELDVLVIGGGVVGAGTALDAVTRGLSVGLVEARDWAAGTSSRSSKLIHGGLRYLEMLDFRLVREALVERGLIVQRLAPHLARPVSFLYPLTHHGWERFYVGAGVLLYDMMGLAIGNTRGLPHHRHLTRRQALQLMPSLRKDVLVGAVQYYDAQVDDARYTMMLVRTAASYGAHVASRARVVGFLREGERVVGVRVRDLEYGRDLEIRAKQVVNATGVWTDEMMAMVGERAQFHVKASKGIHLVVPRDRIHSRTGLILRTEKSVLFVIPWGRHWIIGTTDTAWDLDKAHPAASKSDIEYLLGHVNKVLATPLTHEDVEGVYAGLRPLLAGETEETSKLSREHIVTHSVPGLVVVAGGKYTTYRVMAKDAVDEAAHALGGWVPPSCTDRIPVIGAEGYHALWNARHGIAARTGLHVVRVEHLLRRYGSLIDEVLQLIKERPELGEPLVGAEDYLRAEVVYAASHEGARHLDDVLTRRTRVSIETFDRGVRAATDAAQLMAPVLNWTEEQVKREIEHYRKRVEAERESQEQPDDRTADSARLGAPEIVPVD